MENVGDRILDPMYGTKKSFVQGVVSKVQESRLPDGSHFAVFDVRDSVSNNIVKVAVTDKDILKQIGVGPFKNAAPPQGQLLKFYVNHGKDEDMVFGHRMVDPDIRLSRGEALRADGRNIVPAVARAGLRINLHEMKDMAFILAKDGDKATSRYLENLDQNWKNYIGTLERRMGGDSERDAMQKVLRDVSDVLESSARGKGISLDDDGEMISRFHNRAKELQFALRESRNESAYDDEMLVSNSRSIEMIAPDGVAFRTEMSATILWAAHNTIKAEDRSGSMGVALEGIQSSLIRYRQGASGSDKELLVGLKRAGKALTEMKADAVKDPILAKSLGVAFENVKEAYRWVKAGQKDLTSEINIEKTIASQLGSEKASDPRMRVFADIIAQEMSEGNPVIKEIPADKNLKAVVQFQGGETLIIDKKGNIVMHDENRMLALVDSPDQDRRYFVDGEKANEAKRVNEQDASLAFDTAETSRFAA